MDPLIQYLVNLGFSPESARQILTPTAPGFGRNPGPAAQPGTAREVTWKGPIPNEFGQSDADLTQMYLDRFGSFDVDAISGDSPLTDDAKQNLPGPHLKNHRDPQVRAGAREDAKHPPRPPAGHPHMNRHFVPVENRNAAFYAPYLAKKRY